MVKIIHKLKMKRNTIENTIETMEREQYWLMKQLVEVQACYIRQLEGKNVRRRRRNINKATD